MELVMQLIHQGTPDTHWWKNIQGAAQKRAIVRTCFFPGTVRVGDILPPAR